MHRTLLPLLLCALIVAGAIPPVAVAGDSLGTLREAVRTKSVAPDHGDDDDDDHHHHHHHDHCCDDDDDGINGIYFLLGATAPWWVPVALTGDNYSKRGYFARHPYAPTDAGPNYNAYMIIGEQFQLPGYTWAGRVDGYYGDDFDSLSTVGGHLLLENSSRWGLDTTLDFRHEDLGGGLSDELYTGDFNIVYRFAQNGVIQMRSGLGVNYLTDTNDSDFGFNFTYGGDILLGDPFVLSSELDLGSLGEASVTHFRTTLGAVYRGVEVYTGYDYYEVGDADTSTLISGVRIWF